ncbi:MAG: LysE family translocator [Roseibium sp.]|nr:LysE family translocator [Roseibium sp.]
MTFLPDITTLLAFTAAAIVLIVTPGPDMTLLIGKTLTQGRKAGLASVVGASTGILIHSALAAFGVSVLLAASEVAFTALKIVGALYLIYLAVQAIRKGSAFAVEAVEVSHEPLGRIWLQGLGINLLNPKVVLFFVTFLPQFVSAADPDAAAKLFFLGFYFVLLAFPACSAMVLGAGALARFLRESPAALRAFDWTFAGIMGAFALKLLTAQSLAR